jgi:hypothetical protein
MKKIGVLTFQGKDHSVYVRKVGKQFELVVKVVGQWERLEDTEPFDSIDEAGTVLGNYALAGVYEVELV